MDKNLKLRLIKKLENLDYKKISNINVVLLPDFFVDHFLYFDEFDISKNRIEKIYKQKGGNLPDIKQSINQGGNAANTALGLAKLGIKSHLICRTDKFGLHLLKYFLGQKGVDLSGVKSDGKLAITTALEFGKEHVNVMVGDTGSVSDFSFEILDEKDLDRIQNSDLVCVLNWNLNRYGTDLAYEVFKFAKKNNVRTFFDSGDPTPKKKEIPDLIDKILKGSNLDIFGLNENELSHFTKIDINNENDIINAAKSLKNMIKPRVDIHTSNFSFSVDEECKIIPSIDILKTYRETGAGDSWNAGNLFADILGFDTDERLLFSNIFAAMYISSKYPIHATLPEVIKYIKKL